MTVKTQVSADLQVRFVSLIRALHYPEPPTDTNAFFRSPITEGASRMFSRPLEWVSPPPFFLLSFWLLSVF